MSKTGPTRRLAVGIEYDGTRYAGWQHQPGLLTIQDAVQKALSAVADHPVTVTAAGRTDAGVHACAQVAHFDTQAERPIRGWVLGANSHLPPDIAICWAMDVDRAFHARHTAQGRSYRYCMLRRATRPAILRDRVCWIRSPLDVEAMHEAAQALVGEHDFTSFRAVECQSTTRRAPRGRDLGAGRRPAGRDRGQRQRLPAPHGAQHRGHAAHGRRGRASAGLGRRRPWPRATARAPASPRRRAACTCGRCGTRSPCRSPRPCSAALGL